MYLFPSVQFIQKFLLLVIIFSSNNYISNVIGQTVQTVSIARYIQTTNDLSTLSQILSYQGLFDLFTLLDTPAVGTERITLFAPTNDAFFSSGADLTNGAFVSNLIKYHTVFDREILSGDLTSSSLVVNTLLNDSSLVRLPNGAQVLYLTKSLQGVITINNGNANTPAKITKMDIKCTNGVIHLIDSGNFPCTFLCFTLLCFVN
jgi:uncharacterized surface protein with fasciclin (FAS1) repeats